MHKHDMMSRRQRRQHQRLVVSTLLLLLPRTPSNAFLSSPQPTTSVSNPPNKQVRSWLDFAENAPRNRAGCGTLFLAGGFGAATGAGTRKAEAPDEAEAKQALESSGGDLNRATSLVFQQRLRERGQSDAELGAMLQELSLPGVTIITDYREDSQEVHRGAHDNYGVSYP